MNQIMEKVGLKKSPQITRLLHEMLDILQRLGLPMGDLTPRRLEKMAMAMLAVSDMHAGKDWAEVRSVAEGQNIRTREIIEFINNHFDENISSGSYDDIRRKDLIRPVQMGLVIKSASNPNSDTNDGTRGYALDETFAELCRTFGTDQMDQAFRDFPVDVEYISALAAERSVPKISIALAEGINIDLDEGPHNKIQKAVIEEFLPRFGYGAKVLYIGDTSDKLMHKFSSEMQDIGLNIDDRGMLPDIVAFSSSKKWLYLIEAVHSSNPLDPERCIELQRTVLKDCNHGIVYVTAFLDKKSFGKWMPKIAWETEVWIADIPDHLIHFNGDKFLGPHNQPPQKE